MSPTKSINYEPLTHSNSVQIKGKTYSAGTLSTICIAGVILSFFIPGLGFIISAFFIMAMVYVGILLYQVQKKAWRQFATVNNWSVIAVSGEQLLAVVPLCMQFGHSWSVSEIIRGRIGTAPFDLFTSQFTIGSGKSSRTYTATVMSLPTAEALPHILLDSKKNGGGAYKSKFENSQTLHLEGNFSDHFQLRIENGQQVDALSLIAPDVMQSILDHGQLFDIEIIDKTIHIIAVNDKRTIKELPSFIESALILYNQLTEKIQRYNTNVATHTYQAQVLSRAELEQKSDFTSAMKQSFMGSYTPKQKSASSGLALIVFLVIFLTIISTFVYSSLR